jgi:hypothetical protein
MGLSLGFPASPTPPTPFALRARLDASDAGVFERHNPVSGELATRAAAAVADAHAAATAAAAALPAWSALGPGERRARLMRAADVLETPPEGQWRISWPTIEYRPTGRA